MELPKPKKIKIIGDVFLLLIGFHFFSQFYIGILKESNPSFLVWLRYFGLIIFLHGTISLIRIFLLYHRPLWDKIFFFIRKLLEIAIIPMLFVLRTNASMIPVVQFDGNKVYFVENNETYVEVAYWILTLVIIGVIGNLFYTLYQYFLSSDKTLLKEIEN